MGPAVQGQHTRRSAESDHWGGDDPPPVWVNFDGTPLLVGEIKIEATLLLGDLHVNPPSRRIELSLGFQRIESRPERRWRWGAAGRWIIAAPQPRPEI
jgi:hypothetical protein